MSDNNSDKLMPLSIDQLSFDMVGRTSRDIVCFAPIRTIVRREEEIVLVRRVRKVEEVDSGLACPTHTSQYDGGTLLVYADAEMPKLPQSINREELKNRHTFVEKLWSAGLLPGIQNRWGTTVKLRIDAEGRWNYGTKYHLGDVTKDPTIQQLVDGDGNTTMVSQEKQEADLLFPHITPSALVAIKIKQEGGMFLGYEEVSYGKHQDMTLQPNETVYFINNDQPGVYDDNRSYLTIRWKVL